MKFYIKGINIATNELVDPPKQFKLTDEETILLERAIVNPNKETNSGLPKWLQNSDYQMSLYQLTEKLSRTYTYYIFVLESGNQIWYFQNGKIQSEVPPKPFDIHKLKTPLELLALLSSA